MKSLLRHHAIKKELEKRNSFSNKVLISQQKLMVNDNLTTDGSHDLMLIFSLCSIQVQNEIHGTLHTRHNVSQAKELHLLFHYCAILLYLVKRMRKFTVVPRFDRFGTKQIRTEREFFSKKNVLKTTQSPRI